MRRNLILLLAMCSLVFLWSALGWGQCVQDTGDHGLIDDVFIDCTPPDQFASDSAVVSFDLMFTTDNALANEKIVGWNAALLISANCSARVVIDDTPGGAVFGGTASGSPNDWEARFNSSIPPSGIAPATVIYGAILDLLPPVNAGPSLGAGTHILCHVVVVVYDTCCITIDTTSTQTVQLSVVRNDAVGYLPCWKGPYECCVTPCAGEAAPVCNAPATDAGLAGGVIDFPVTATDADVNCCYTFTSCSFDILENPPSEGAASLLGTCGANTASLTFSWPTSNLDPEGVYTIVFTFTTDCDEVVACTTKVTLQAKCLFARIGNDAIGSPGGKVQVPITIEATGTSVGGFTFCIEYDPVLLTFVSLERGLFFDEPGPFAGAYKWHYLVWRNNPSTVIHKFKLCVVGIGKLYYYEGKCLPQGDSGKLMLTFRLSNNELYRCFRAPIIWERLDPECIVNAFSDCSGNVVNVPDDPAFFDPQLCPGQYPKAEVVPCARLVDGGIVFKCDIDPLVRGDINVNGFPYEIGDAVLFANYFLSGVGVFSADAETRERQINATDINADGLTLSVADLVYLLRILAGDQAPLGGAKLTPLANTVDVTHKGNLIYSESRVDLGAAWFVFKGEATSVVPMITGVEVKSNVSNGETKVLVYGMHKGDKISAGTSNLFKIHGEVELTKVEAAEYYSAAVNVNIHNTSIAAMPKTFGLSQNYPNPFNASTTIRFALPMNSDVSLKIYNVAGQLVKEYKQQMNAGYRSITWDGSNAKGEIVASGVYFYKLQAADFTKTLKMTLLK
ncbi:MAG: Alpha amylase catalytic region [candidate division Zixibacteria bacterium RBG-1]|nr:MAG: Alpha amylase catalytic region [candidate division Zixibacteria bacterium RBG-1]